MYAGSFAASLKGIACTRGFVIFTRVRVNKHIPPFTGGGFLTLSPSPDFICCGPCWLGMSACLPHGWQATVRFRYAAQRFLKDCMEKFSL
nr:MAG TPA: epoxyqueuosine reductase [Caudoviricetes sp.]